MMHFTEESEVDSVGVALSVDVKVSGPCQQCRGYVAALDWICLKAAVFIFWRGHEPGTA